MIPSTFSESAYSQSFHVPKASQGNLFENVSRTKTKCNISSSSSVHDTALNSSETRESRKHHFKNTQSQSKKITKHRMPSESFVPSLRDEGSHRQKEIKASAFDNDEKPKFIKTVQQGKSNID